MKVGIFGGTFDPIHYGHLVAAEEARQSQSLDRVLFVPSARPPHKYEYNVTAPELRVDMVKLAIADNPFFELSTVDLDRPGPSYGVDTVATLQQQLGPQTKLFFIMGEDTLADLPAWHDPQRLLDECEIIAVNRPGYHSFSLRLLERELPGVEKRVHQVRIPEVAVWSTELRARISGGLSVRYLLPDSVLRFIVDHGLYLNFNPPRHSPAA